MTPARVYLRGYFFKLIGRKKAETKKMTRKRVKPLYSGEALTTDEIYERLDEDDQQKHEKKQQKAARAKARKGYIYNAVYYFSIQSVYVYIHMHAGKAKTRQAKQRRRQLKCLLKKVKCKVHNAHGV